MLEMYKKILNCKDIKMSISSNTICLTLSVVCIVGSISLLSIEFNLVLQEYNIISNAWADDVNGTDVNRYVNE
jgi:hypothetical protein